MDNLNNKDIHSFVQLYNCVSLAVAGFFGVFIRHLYIKRMGIIQKILEYVAGALCSVYGAHILSNVLGEILIKYNFGFDNIDSKQKLLSLSAFLCGMFGLSLCECGFNYFKKLTLS